MWFLAAFGGTLADRLGFRRALSLAYLILSCSYFLLGSIGSPWFAPVRSTVPLVGLVTFMLMLPALGIALVKPCVVGTTARASKENVRSIGYSIYYTLVNIGGRRRPVRRVVGASAHERGERLPRGRPQRVRHVLRGAVVLQGTASAPTSRTVSLAQAAKNFGTVLSNPRFMLFLLIFSGYWIVYWQEFIILPLYVHDYINPNTDTELLLVTGPVIGDLAADGRQPDLRRRCPPSAPSPGTLMSALALAHSDSCIPPSRWLIATLVAVALGEITQSPRYYEYVSRLAPPGQQGTYMGFAFLPIGIGSLSAASLAACSSTISARSRTSRNASGGR